MKREFMKQNVGMDIAKDDFKVNLSMLTTELNVVVKGSKTFNNNQKGFEEPVCWTSSKLIRELDRVNALKME
jgi:hypothetical protein